MTVHLERLTPAAFDGWTVSFGIEETFGGGWVVVGGQMVALHAASLEVRLGIRPTDDVDVLVDVRARRGGTRELGDWLNGVGFAHAGMSPDGIGHRWTRPAERGPGTVVVDVLAPEGLGPRTPLVTVPPARTIEVPGGTQALQRAERIHVSVTDVTGQTTATGHVWRPDLLGAIVAKAAATTIPVRENPDRDWQDVAMLLANVPDPFALAEVATAKDRARLAKLERLEDRQHLGWALLGDDDHRRGVVALAVLMGAS